jgi:hypothetical protein
MADYLKAETQDAYVPALTLGPAGQVRSITFLIANQSCFVQFNIGRYPHGAYWESFDRLLTPTVGNVVERVNGVRFRSAIAGQPALIVAELDYSDDPDIQGQSELLTPVA